MFGAHDGHMGDRHAPRTHPEHTMAIWGINVPLLGKTERRSAIWRIASPITLKVNKHDVLRLNVTPGPNVSLGAQQLPM